MSSDVALLNRARQRAKRDAKAFDGRRQLRGPFLGGAMPCANRPMHNISATNQSDGLIISGNYAYKHVAGPGHYGDIRVAYANHIWYTDLDNDNPITVRAMIYVPSAPSGSSQDVPLYFNGRRDVVIDPGGFIESDIVGLVLTPGLVFYTITWVRVDAGEKFPLSNTMQQSLAERWRTSTTDNSDAEDYTSGATGHRYSNLGAVTNTSTSGYGPLAITAAVRDPAVAPCLVGIGDSITSGYSELGGAQANQGDIARAANSIVIPYLSLGHTGDKIGQYLQNYYRRRQRWLSAGTHLAIFYGINDIYEASDTLANIQANSIAAWNDGVSRGMKVLTATVTPKTNSSDTFLTVAGQTNALTVGQEAVRTGWNAWLRDGAPILNGAAAATGSSAAGTLRVGDSHHPVWQVVDRAAQVEVTGPAWNTNAQGSGTLTSGLATVTGLTVSRGAFAVGDDIIGAGSSLQAATKISAVDQGAGTMTLSKTATASGATALASPLTVDGLHPNSNGFVKFLAGWDIAALLDDFNAEA